MGPPDLPFPQKVCCEHPKRCCCEARKEGERKKGKKELGTWPELIPKGKY